jgi:hypothetical protein
MAGPDRLPNSRWRRPGAACLYVHGGAAEIVKLGTTTVTIRFSDGKKRRMVELEVKDYEILPPA